jgi:hypothetical protein
MDKYFPDEEEVDAAISAPNVDASGAFAVSSLILSFFRALIICAVPLRCHCSSRRL